MTDREEDKRETKGADQRENGQEAKQGDKGADKKAGMEEDGKQDKEQSEERDREYSRTTPDREPSEVREHGLLTYDDYAALDDGNRYELANGSLELMSPGPDVGHQVVGGEMYRSMLDSCSEDYFILIAPVDVILSRYEVRQPDLLMVHRSRMHIVSRRGVNGPPDLVVEILSPYTLRRDKVDKLKAYARFQVPEYWIADPVLGILEQYMLKDGHYELTDTYQGDEPVRSPRIACIRLTMGKLMAAVPHLE